MALEKARLERVFWEPHDQAPVYRQFAEYMSTQLSIGVYQIGEAIPPERRLCEVFKISRITVRKAIALLVEQGVLEQRRGSGTYVAKHLVQNLSTLTGFSEDIRARGLRPECQVLYCGMGDATPDEALAFGHGAKMEVSRLKRLRLADGSPIAIEDAVMLKEALPDPTRVQNSLYQVLGETGMCPVRAVQKFSAIALPEEEARILNTHKGAPALYIIRVGYLGNGQVVEYTRSTYRGDRWDFVTELGK